MSLWDHRQFAMELIARGGYSVSAAVVVVKQFEREWAPVKARLSAEDHAYAKRLDDLRKTGSDTWTRAAATAWMRETLALVKKAGDEAEQDVLDARATP